MVACGALRVTWLSGLMESGRPIKFSSTLFITGGGGGGGFCVVGGGGGGFCVGGRSHEGGSVVANRV